MTTFNDLHEVAGWIGEMLGMFVLALGSLLSIFVAKSGGLGLDTKLKQRGLVAIGVAISVILGLELSKGLGGHGQLNMGVTLLVTIGKLPAGNISDGEMGHGYEMLNDALPVIGFQFIGALMAAGTMLLVAKVSGRWAKLAETFNHNTQPIKRTLGVEALGNIFWMLVIAGMLGMVMHDHSGTNFGFWTLMITAGMSKILIILFVDDFGGAQFNVTYWFSKWIVTLVAQKSFPKPKTWLGDGLTVFLNLGISSAAGAIFLGCEMLRAA